MIREKIKEFVKGRREEIVSTLMDLIKIPSVSTDRAACEQMASAVKDLYQKHGFKTTDGEEYLLAHHGQGSELIGLFAHGDVVEGGENWLYTSDPFEPKIHGDFIIGRGAWDDKSAIICSLYTLIALKELNIPVEKEIVCFTGLNEENGMSDIQNYVKTNTPPTFSLVLDAGFPVYYGDKGKTWARVSAKKTLTDISEFFGGKMINIILANGEARVKYTKELFEDLKETQRVKIEKQGEEIVIKSEGVSAHGATPNGSINGACLIAELLKDSKALNSGDREIMNDLYTVLSSPYGESVGIDNKDSEFGDLTMTNGIVEVANGKLSFTLDIRYGKDVKAQEMIKVLEKSLDKLGFDLEIISSDEAYSIDKSHPYLQKYMEAYREYTGETEKPMCINAGSTYAKCMENACEIGTRFGGGWLELPTGHGCAHQPDENTSIEGLLNAIEIIIYSVIRLAGKQGDK
ncbi:MAG: Sapep family Mn(2+)-dependent dipeptidase [Clostridia bacterium]|nr:Sapep family Mn(2+)-dependent dipeptidase [Clostridia bacterium]